MAGKKRKQNMSKEIFTSKSNTLRFLQNRVAKSKIEKIFDFSVSEWKCDQEHILTSIKTLFKGEKIVIRSSALDEDSFDKSNAGNYASVLDIHAYKKKDVEKAVKKVINSYNKGNKNINNQVLIQKQTTDVKTSGVVFSRNPQNGAPYYIINYEDSSFTDTVTRGLVGNVIKIHRGINEKNLPKKWKSLILAIQEIEKIVKNDFLDFEFGISDKEIIIFQTRPLILDREKIWDKKISRIINKNKNLLNKTEQSHIFSDMTDWNPAEIIGNSPNNLDYSIYDYLIMKKSWKFGRVVLGYTDVKPSNLMKKFGNKPYVDVRKSFSSLIPGNIKKNIKKKLLKFYLQKIQEKPYLHDKAEFEILFTCYDFTIHNRLKELKKYGFTKYEINELKKNLLSFTNNIISRYASIIQDVKQSYDIMEKRREEYLKELDFPNMDHNESLRIAELLFEDCKVLGAIPFSTIARLAFIGNILLKGLTKFNKIESSMIEGFMNSISTPLSEIRLDVKKLDGGNITKSKFLKKYGHLRPGTYDITKIRYDQNDNFLYNIKFQSKLRKSKGIPKKEMVSILKKNGLQFSNISFFDFVKNTITEREKSKFEFTKNLSQAIELIAQAGMNLGFSRNDMSNLELEDILKYRNLKKNDLKNIWNSKIKKNKNVRKLNSLLSLPPIIFSKKDFEVIQYHISKPNYITQKKITASIISLSINKDLEHKIILIENADPGYDWIFTKNPAGLITKYGGVASHMGLRCAEIGLPAAIGCGEILYEKLSSSSKVELDCNNNQIFILENKKIDQYVEEKKILKSLGYIK